MAIERWAVGWIAAKTALLMTQEEYKRVDEANDKTLSQAWDRMQAADDHVDKVRARILKEEGIDPEIYVKWQVILTETEKEKAEREKAEEPVS